MSHRMQGLAVDAVAAVAAAAAAATMAVAVAVAVATATATAVGAGVEGRVENATVCIITNTHSRT
jgi:hypothetical protein